MDNVAGDWLTARRDGRNLARADLPGRMTEAPTIRWHLDTGGDIKFAQTVNSRGAEALLAQSGSTLAAIRWDGTTLWRDGFLGVTRILHAARFGATEAWHALVTTDDSTVALIDVDLGEVVWTWSAEARSNLAGPGASKIFRADDAWRWVCFPTYSTRGVCFDFTDPSAPILLWDRDFGDAYDAGFGPAVIVADFTGGGSPDVLISSRTGTEYRRDDTEALVLGRENGQLYQAILDAATGDIKLETSYRPDPGDYPCARPYGLVQAVEWEGPGSARLGVVQVSCQVEEYFAVTAHTVAGLSRAWGRFVEKDWPEDHRELRPQITSVADLRGDGRPSLVVGLWQDGLWNTLILDPYTGQAVETSLAGRYFWGCHDLVGDGRAELIVSRESSRRPGSRAQLEIVDGVTLETIAALPDAALVTSADSPLPAHLTFHADRRSAIEVRDETGVAALLIRRDDGIHAWNTTGTRLLAGPEYTRADWHAGELILSTSDGRVSRCGPDLKPAGHPVPAPGRYCQPLAWTRIKETHTVPEIVTDLAGGEVIGITDFHERSSPGQTDAVSGELSLSDLVDAQIVVAGIGRWRVPGMLPALHVDSGGTRRMVVATEEPALVIHREPGAPVDTTVKVALPAPVALAMVPFGSTFRVLANLRTGVHTAAIAVFDPAGRPLWTDLAHGGHPSRPGVVPLDDGTWLVAADDHGRMRLYSAHGRLIAENDWTAAYTTPLAIPGTTTVLRADGIHGIELIDLSGVTLWRNNTELWRYFPGRAALARAAHPGEWLLGAVSRDGEFAAIDTATGHTVWTFDLGATIPERAVAAGDVDGDGRDEFLAGTRDGRLLCLRDGDIIWQQKLSASVTNPVLADLDGDGLAEILVATADGRLTLLGPTPYAVAGRANNGRSEVGHVNAQVDGVTRGRERCLAVHRRTGADTERDRAAAHAEGQVDRIPLVGELVDLITAEHRLVERALPGCLCS